MTDATERNQQIRLVLGNGHYEYLDRDEAVELRDEITRAIHDLDDEVNER